MTGAGKSAKIEPKTTIKVLFIAGFGPIVPDPAASRKLYSDTFGIVFEEAPGEHLHTGEVDGAKHFALWPLAQAAESRFGVSQWPDDIAVPQAWIEFDVEDVGAATKQLKRQGS